MYKDVVSAIVGDTDVGCSLSEEVGDQCIHAS